MIRKIFQIGFGAVATAYVAGGALAIAGLVGNAREPNSIWHAYAAFGAMILVIGLLATAQHLLERGADPNRVAPDGMTLAKKLTRRRDEYAVEKQTLPPQFTSLWASAEARGIFAQPQ